MFGHECGLFGSLVFFFQAEDGIRDLVRSRGLGDVYKRQVIDVDALEERLGRGEGRLLGELDRFLDRRFHLVVDLLQLFLGGGVLLQDCLLYTSDAADERSSVDLGGRRIIKKKKKRT